MAAPERQTLGVTPWYDPQSESILMATRDQAARLKAGGYAVGDDATKAYAASGIAGSTLSALLGAAHGVTGGGSSLLIDQVAPSAKPMLRAIEKAHPYLHTGAEIAGGAALMYGTGGASAAIGMNARAARIIVGAVSGGVSAAASASRNDHPLTAEHLRQGVGLGLLFSVAGEGADKILSGVIPATQRAYNGLLDRLVDNGVFRAQTRRSALKVGPQPFEGVPNNATDAAMAAAKAGRYTQQGPPTATPPMAPPAAAGATTAGATTAGAATGAAPAAAAPAAAAATAAAAPAKSFTESLRVGVGGRMPDPGETAKEFVQRLRQEAIEAGDQPWTDSFTKSLRRKVSKNREAYRQHLAEAAEAGNAVPDRAYRGNLDLADTTPGYVDQSAAPEGYLTKGPYPKDHAYTGYETDVDFYGNSKAARKAIKAGQVPRYADTEAGKAAASNKQFYPGGEPTYVKDGGSFAASLGEEAAQAAEQTVAAAAPAAAQAGPGMSMSGKLDLTDLPPVYRSTSSTKPTPAGYQVKGPYPEGHVHHGWEKDVNYWPRHKGRGRVPDGSVPNWHSTEAGQQWKVNKQHYPDGPPPMIGDGAQFSNAPPIFDGPPPAAGVQPPGTPTGLPFAGPTAIPGVGQAAADGASAGIRSGGFTPAPPRYVRGPRNLLGSFGRILHDVGNVSLGAQFIPGVGHKALGWLTGGAYSGARVLWGLNSFMQGSLNNQAGRQGVINRIMQPGMVGLGKAVRHALEDPLPVIEDHHLDHRKLDKIYTAATKPLDRLLADPSVVDHITRKKLGPVLQDADTLHTNLVQGQLIALKYLDENRPKDPRPPALLNREYDPPRAEKIRYLRKFRAVNDPVSVLKDPTIEGVAAVQATHPETLKNMRTQIASGLLDRERSYTPSQKKRISILMGMPFSAQMDPGYIARLQKLASGGMPAVQQQMKRPPGRPPKVKVNAASANTIAPGSQQNEVENAQ